jgi:hypothetical protein
MACFLWREKVVEDEGTGLVGDVLNPARSMSDVIEPPN